MMLEVIEKVINILGPIATLSKERRDLKDIALRTIVNALDETYIYYRDLEQGVQKDLDREALIAKYWSAAAIPMRHFDPDLAQTCDMKSEYWINPTNYDDSRIKELGIRLDDVRQAYRALLKPKFYFSKKSSDRNARI